MSQKQIIFSDLREGFSTAPRAIRNPRGGKAVAAGFCHTRKEGKIG